MLSRAATAACRVPQRLERIDEQIPGPPRADHGVVSHNALWIFGGKTGGAGGTGFWDGVVLLRR